VLLGIGLPPVTANVSNTLGLAPGSFVGAYGYRRELAGQLERAVRLGVASVLGGALGAVLLLTLPARAFQAIVPVLIVLALLLVVLGPRISGWLEKTRPVSSRVTPLLWLLTLGAGGYGGYFGAAQGVLLMGVFGLLLAESLQRQNALKNVLAGLVNAVAAIVFVVSDAPINWAAAGLIAAGSILGGLIGARVGRRLPANVLRGVIVAVGVVAIVKLLA
jgi:uncharacterized membrane protein YfcA